MSAISSLSSGRWSHGFRIPGPRPPAVRHLQTVWPPAQSPPPAERTAGYVLQIHLFLRSISSPPSKAWPYGRHGRRHDKILHSANDIPLSLVFHCQRIHVGPEGNGFTFALLSVNPGIYACFSDSFVQKTNLIKLFLYFLHVLYSFRLTSG